MLFFQVTVEDVINNLKSLGVPEKQFTKLACVSIWLIGRVYQLYCYCIALQYPDVDINIAACSIFALLIILLLFLIFLNLFEYPPLCLLNRGSPPHTKNSSLSSSTLLSPLVRKHGPKSGRSISIRIRISG